MSDTGTETSKRADDRVAWRAAPRTETVTQARDVVRDTVRAWGLPGCLEPALAIAAELVANAVVHARTPLVLRVRRLPGHLRLEVADREPDPARLLPAQPAHAGARQRGLVIVDAFASRWGTQTYPGGKTVWAELDIAPLHAPG